jgi:RNase adapter protein RapZ
MELELVLITGMSGSGKSVALHAVEDAGYYSVDNLPPELLLSFVKLQQERDNKRVSIAMDVRSAKSLPQVPERLRALAAMGVVIKSLFLESTTDTLVRRYSESRRKHPLSQTDGDADGSKDEHRALVEAIELERELLADLREHAHVIDTSLIRPSQLQRYVKSLILIKGNQLTLVFESFAFKRGIPGDADYVFDVRMLPNPHYEPELKALTGKDDAVVAFFQRHDQVHQMLLQIAQFLDQWLDPLANDNRSYVTVAIGCTGGQHRSVYLVEALTKLFADRWTTLSRHRELDATPGRFPATSFGWPQA